MADHEHRPDPAASGDEVGDFGFPGGSEGSRTAPGSVVDMARRGLGTGSGVWDFSWPREGTAIWPRTSAGSDGSVPGGPAPSLIVGSPIAGTPVIGKTDGVLDLSPDELLTTTRAVRKRLDLERPIERSVIRECIEIALQAPSGSNTQRWHFILIDDPETKLGLADLYRRQFELYEATPEPMYGEDDSRARRQVAVRSSARYLADNYHRVPLILIPCLDGRPDRAGASMVMQASYFGSILPAVWSFMLAGRARGLGSSWTTMHLAHERDAAELIGIPYDKVAQVGMMPVAYTIGTDFKPAPRRPLDDIVHWNRW